MRIFFVLFLVSISGIAGAKTVSELAACYKELRPALGSLQMQVSGDKGPLIASGRRGDPAKLGLYVWQSGSHSFYPIGSERDSTERVEDGKANLYYVRLGKHDFVLRNAADQSMTIRGQGTHKEFLGKSRPGDSPVHAELTTKEEVKKDDAEALAAFTKSFTELLARRDHLLGAVGRAGAVEKCLKSFPVGTDLGDAIAHANRRFTTPEQTAGVAARPADAHGL